MNDSTKVALSRPSEIPAALAQMVWMLLFAAGTALAARLEIPHQPVPYTLQTLMVLLSGAFLGGRNGMMSQIAYIGAGVLGLPVFAGGAFGAAVLLGPSGGYLIAFPFAALVVGRLVRRRHTLPWIAFSMGAGLAIVFTLGALQLWVFSTHSASTALTAGILIFSWWDILKLSAASMIYYEMGKRWKRLPPDARENPEGR
jgi:biotin transport system substrate-specific component